jgi:hypothetical protein
VEGSRERLGVEAIDLYQIHWPVPDEEIEEGWSTLAELKERGVVRPAADGRPFRPNGPGEQSPGMRPLANSLGPNGPPRSCGLKGRGSLHQGAEPSRIKPLAALQAAG